MIYKDMRDAFFEELYKLMKKDKNVILLLGDQGASNLPHLIKKCPNQIINMGPMEQNIINVAAGLALNGKKVYIHAITPFITLRCFEQISLMFGLHNLPVTIVGSGTGIMYDHEGPTHHATQDIALMNSIPNMNIYSPSDTVSMAKFMQISYKLKQPCYIRFDYRALNGDNIIYDKIKHNFKDGLCVVKKGKKETIATISNGKMLHNRLEINLDKEKVIDLYRMKPLNEKSLKNTLKGIKNIVILEENIKDGAMTSIISKFLCENNINVNFTSFGLEDFVQDYGKREELLNKFIK